jgi:hypothetical protein
MRGLSEARTDFLPAGLDIAALKAFVQSAEAIIPAISPLRVELRPAIITVSSETLTTGIPSDHYVLEHPR